MLTSRGQMHLHAVAHCLRPKGANDAGGGGWEAIATVPLPGRFRAAGDDQRASAAITRRWKFN